MRKSKGGGQDATVVRQIDPGDIAVAVGYEVTLVSDSLNFPTAITFNEQGQVFVTESGYSYGEVFTTPRLLRLDANRKQVIAEGGKNGPWTGIDHYRGNFYVAEGGQTEGGKILRITPQGEISALISDLPGKGDHHTNGPAINNGFLYFGQGTATNSAIVGPDNAEFGWLARFPSFHDLPCQDITLNGVNYTTDSATTGAYVPFGTPTSRGQVIKAALPCTGAVMRIPIGGGDPEWVAWGFRNPFGLAFAPNGDLYLTENGYDVRGSRPVWGAGDVLWKVQQGFWYGWPDYSAGKRINGVEEFKPPKKDTVKKILATDPGTPPKPAAILGVHSSSNGLDFSRSENFGFEQQAFIAQFGDMASDVGKVLHPVGFKVVRVDVTTGVIRDFAVNKSRKNGPASKLRSGGFERPVAVKFSPDGSELYVVDFGILLMTEKGPQPVPYSGVVWKIKRRKS